jgi:hypothetical protein
VRREIQNSQESLISLAERYGVNPKTVEKWRKRDFILEHGAGKIHYQSIPVHCGTKHLINGDHDRRGLDDGVRIKAGLQSEIFYGIHAYGGDNRISAADIQDNDAVHRSFLNGNHFAPDLVSGAQSHTFLLMVMLKNPPFFC